MDEQQVIRTITSHCRDTLVLQAAAATCATNFKWLEINSENAEDQYRPVYLLDFDLIASTIKTLATFKLAKVQPKREAEKFGTSFTVTDIFGPYTMAILCNNLTDFCLPLGAKKE